MRHLFRRREILLRSDDGFRCIVLSSRLQMAAAALLLVGTGWLAFTTIAALTGHFQVDSLDREIRQAKAQIDRAEAANQMLLSQVAESHRQFVESTRALGGEAGGADAGLPAHRLVGFDRYIAEVAPDLPAAARGDPALHDNLRRLGADLRQMIALNLVYGQQIATLQRELARSEETTLKLAETDRWLIGKLRQAAEELALANGSRSDSERTAADLNDRIAGLRAELAEARERRDGAEAEAERLQRELANAASGKPAARVAAAGAAPVVSPLPAGRSAVDYPLRKLWAGRGPEDALVLAVMRQESSFRANAVSPQGARGLMQLMPATAEYVAGRLKLGYHQSKLIGEPDFNMTIGRAYLRQLLELFDGSYVLSIAAYNAGPNRVLEWIDQYGDPRDIEVDTAGWIDRIPFGETRNYVRRVLKSLDIYRRTLYASEAPQCNGEGSARAFMIGMQ